MQIILPKLNHLVRSQKAGVTLVASFLALVVLLTLALQPAAAQSGIELSTVYPGINVTAGETVTIPLQIRNAGTGSQIVELKAISVPENWKVSFRGRGREVYQVLVKGSSWESADLKVEVPEQAKPGNYSLKVVAVNGKTVLDNLQINLTIAEISTKDDELEAQYSELKGPSDATFKFKLNLTNNGATEQTYSLGALAPAGWQVAFKPSYERQQVASISVKAGETQGLDVEVIPAVAAEAGEYTIPVQVVSSTSKATEELKVIISGSYELELTTPSGRLNAEVVAGDEQKVNLEVRNNGTAVLNNITFSSREPQNWAVSFDPETIDTLSPGESRQITATIKADSKAISGDYVVVLTASTRETRDQAELRVTVKTSTLWGIVGLLIVLAVIAGVYWAFRTYGRR